MRYSPDVLTTLAVVPVVRVDDVDHADTLAEGLLGGGLPVAEITFRTPAAAAVIAALAARHGHSLLIGAGTVLDIGTVDAAVDAGARFIVTPGFNPTVVRHCLARGIPVVPGVNSPSQVELALELGLTEQKFFPAVASGGIAMLDALAGPYSRVRFMPTGGITADTAAQWLALPNVLAVGGSWIAPASALAAGDVATIAAHAAAARGLADARAGTRSVSADSAAHPVTKGSSR